MQEVISPEHQHNLYSPPGAVVTALPHDTEAPLEPKET
jgi:hypothetical protein